jgi:hypothetical protein
LIWNTKWIAVVCILKGYSLFEFDVRNSNEHTIHERSAEAAD